MSCPACGSFVAMLLSTLGKLAWLRCRDCGMDYHVDAETFNEQVELSFDIAAELAEED